MTTAVDYSLLSSDFHDARSIGTWVVVLDRLELDVVRMEHYLDQDRPLRTDVWDVPVAHGPLPDELRPRAEDLAARQQQCLERLSTALGLALRQHAVAEAVTRVSPRAHGLPMYVDVAV